MGTLRVTTIKGTGDGAPILSNGFSATGIGTATTLHVGSGIVTASSSGIHVNTGVVTARQFSGDITGVGATFSGAVSVAGTITYNDTTNIDSVGLITARAGIQVTANGVNVAAGIVTSPTIHAGAGITLTASGIVNAGFTTITGATETVTGVTTYPLAGRKVIVECDAAKGTVFSHDLANGNVGIVSLTGTPIRGNSFTTYTIIFTQLSSTPVGNGNTTPRNGIGTNVFLDGGFTGFTTTAKVATASTVTLSTTASDLDIVTLGVHYNGGTTTVPANWAVFANGNSVFRFGTWGY